MSAEVKKNPEYQNVGFAFAVVQDSEGRILLTWQGSQDKYDRTPWGLPSATNRFGETPEEVLVRKIRQDWGIELKVNEIFPSPDRPDEPLTEKVHIFGISDRQVFKVAYLTEILAGQLKNPEEFVPHQAEFVSFEEALSRNLDDFSRIVIEELKRLRTT